MKALGFLCVTALLASCLNGLTFATCFNATCPTGYVCRTSDQICVRPDGGPADSGMNDSGVMDSGVMDSGMPDSGPFDAGPPVPLPRFGVTLVRGEATYGTVYALGGIDAQGQLSTRVEEFQTHSIVSLDQYQWNPSPLRSLPQPLAFASAGHYHNDPIQDCVMLAGGMADAGTTSDAVFADLGAGVPVWGAASAEPAARRWGGATLAAQTGNAVLWFIGGFDRNGAPLSVVDSFDTRVLDAGSGGGWGTAPNLGHARGGLGVDVALSTTDQPVVYAIGGWEADGGGGLQPSAVAEQYVIDAGWMDLPPLPTARGGLAVATDENLRIFAIGGNLTVPGAPPMLSAEIDVLDADAGTWTVLDAGLPSARWGLGAAFAYDGGKPADVIIIFGGQLADGGVSGETDILNPATLSLVVLGSGG